MHAGARETHEDTEFGRGLVQDISVSVVVARARGQREGQVFAYPLRAGRIAVDAFVVIVCLLDFQQLRIEVISRCTLQARSFCCAMPPSPQLTPSTPHLDRVVGLLAYLAPRLRIHLPHFAHDGRLKMYATVLEEILRKSTVVLEGGVVVVVMGRVAVEIQGRSGPKWERVARVHLSLHSHQQG